MSNETIKRLNLKQIIFLLQKCRIDVMSKPLSTTLRNKDESNGSGLEIPPSFNYSIDFATQSEFNDIFIYMKQNNRQTMNFRLMPTSQMLVLKDMDFKGGPKIAGWGGLAYKDRQFAELFSQFLHAEYRTFMLGLVLFHTRAIILQANGIKTGYFRMTRDGNADLLEIRRNSGLYHLLEQQDIDPQWKSYCTHCELYGVHCLKQSYFRFNVDELVTFGARRIGTTNATEFPKKILLAPTQLRMGKRPYSPRWAA